ncbi:MAG: 4-(cytidine 5'-diphospho)-2-C-methyl-D-erythritol kinase [Hyphomicrobiales bacterium]|nr:4-(cytidine 5'-diphospho)-2-C-methyl-D-erythritol kinase [Hyphomicrobiales bacterium]
MTESISVVELAKAKVNLTLEVLGKRPDGYHELRSIVAFADFGDTLTLTPGRSFALHSTGPMALNIDGPNLIEKAAGLMRALFVDETGDAAKGFGRFDLAKRIPVAAGLGGGSADAAAAIRAIMRASPALQPATAALNAAALKIGADVPVCLAQVTAYMAGVGEAMTPLPKMPSFAALLVNPGVKLSTRDVFQALAAEPLKGNEECASDAANGVERRLSAGDWASCLMQSCNDLEPPARRLAPEIDDVLSALSSMTGCWLARLSGSGPTCFALFETNAQAEEAAATLRRDRQQWWCVATQLG